MADNSRSEADIILNRTNVALARSQRLIHSWLAHSQPSSQAEADEAPFAGDSEVGGLGSRALSNEEPLPHGLLRRKKLSPTDRLLDQLLGTKAADAHRKARAATHPTRGLAVPGLSQAAAKTIARAKPGVQRRAEESDAEEGGRAAAFPSKKARPMHAKPSTRDSDAVPADTDLQTPTKRKAGSYLDELLAQKARRKKQSKTKQANRST